MNNTRYLLRIINSTIMLLILLSIGLPCQPVLKDPNINSVSFTQFQNLETPEELWQELNNLHYWEIPLSIPDGYYDSLNFNSKSEFRESLHQLIEKGHIVFPYTHPTLPGEAGHKTDTWDIIALCDAHPVYNDQVLDLYFNGTFARQLKGTTISLRYDREHSWPKSLGFNKDVKTNPAYSDCHHLFAAYQPYNSSRSNKPFGERDSVNEAVDNLKRPTILNLNRGGEEGILANYSLKNVWETWSGRRGDIARAIFYMELRYDGYTSLTRKEAELKLTDDITLVTKNEHAWESGSEAYMGLKSVLLKWHNEDPVDDLERRRNNVVYLFQKNRNPFIDHPVWADILYGNEQIAAAKPAPELWINEFHYDNSGEDTAEFVEIAGTAGTSLEGWQLIGYNGSNGLMYRIIALNGVLDNENTSGYGAAAFDFPGLQNGPADGFALINPNNEIVQFLTYEGTITAGDGPAAGETSDGLSVSETGETPAGYSLQLKGNGRSYKDFQWHIPSAGSPGRLNEGQYIR